jgi:hypothetical protein
MDPPEWFERPALWLDRQLAAQTEYVRNRFPVDDEKLAKLRETKRQLDEPSVRFWANALWWLLVYNGLFCVLFTIFDILWGLV